MPSCCAPGEHDVFCVENNALTLFALTETPWAACRARIPVMFISILLSLAALAEIYHIAGHGQFL